MLSRQRDSGDAGITLIELVVAMALATIIGAMTLTLFVNVNDSTQTTTDRTIDTAQARVVLQSWTSYLAVADGPTAGDPSHRFEWLTADDTFFYANLGNRSGSADAVSPPTGVWLRLTGGHFIEEQFAQGSTTPSVCRILAANATASPLFRASDTSGASMSGQDLGSPLASGGPDCTDLPPSVTQTDLAAVSALEHVGRVTVAFTITDSRGKRSVGFESTAAVPTLTAAAS